MSTLSNIGGTFNSVSNEPTTGEIVFAPISQTVPPGYLLCNGAVLTQSSYSTLYSKVGLITSRTISSSVNFVFDSTTTITLMQYTKGKLFYSDLNSLGEINSGSTTSTAAGNLSIYPSLSTTYLKYAGNRFVAAGDGAYLATTTTGNTGWTKVNTGITNGSVTSLIHDGNNFVITNTFGNIILSSTGTTWVTKSSVSNMSYASAIAYGGNLYVYAGLAGGTRIGTTTDFITQSSYSLSILDSISQLAYGANLFVYGTTGGSGVGNIATSTDGNVWTVRTTLGGGKNGVTALTYQNNLFVYGASLGNIATSTDAITWTARTSGTPSTINVIEYLNNLWIYGGATGNLATSTDAITWTQRTSGVTSAIDGLAYANNAYWFSTKNAIYTSTDAVTWSLSTRLPGATPTTASIYSLTYGNDLYLYGGHLGQLATSTDGVTWTPQSSGTTSSIYTVTYGAGLYVYGGVAGVYATSTDAVTWTARTIANSTVTITSIIYANRVFVASAGDPVNLATNGNLWRSADGITWTRYGVLNQYSGVVYGNSTYLAFGGAGNPVAYTSTDAITWTSRTTNISGIITAGYYNSEQNLFIIGSSTGYVATSTDGITWTIAGLLNGPTRIYCIDYKSPYYYLGNSAGFITSLISANYNPFTNFALPNIPGDTLQAYIKT